MMPYPICTSRSGNVRHRCGGDWAGCRLFLGGTFQEGVCRCLELKYRVLWGSPSTPHSIDDLPTPPHVCCCRKNWWVVVRRGTNGCLDLRRHASALDGQVSAEWSRCPDSMARRARNSVAPMRRSSAGWMPARIGRLSAGVGRRHPVTMRKASLIVGSMRRVWALRHKAGAQYSAVECTRARVAPDPVSSDFPDLCEISDLLLFVSHFASQSKGIKFGDNFHVCCVI